MAAPIRGAAPPGAAVVAWSEGFYEEEGCGPEAFRWMGLAGRLAFAPTTAERFLELWLRGEFADLSQTVTASAGGRGETFPLVRGWGPLSIVVPPGAGAVELRANRLFPPALYPADSRRLAVRARGPVLHADPRRHAAVRRRADNAVRNTREMLAGAATLESTPPTLGIDLHGACNVKPPCVYCEWDDAKAQEGSKVDVPFTTATLTGWGDTYANAGRLINCSIGEPFLLRDIDALLDAFGDDGKTLEISTNGQTLTDRNIERLVGRDVLLYISLDAATPATYARLRNDTFDRIVANIRRLVRAKGGRAGRPLVFLVFMPMRANLHELEDFARLCAELEVDRMVLRPLNDTPGNGLDWQRGGYRFRYADELLPFDELVRASGRAAESCRRLGVELSDQMNFGGALEQSFAVEFADGRRAVAAAEPAALAAPALAPAPLPPPAEEVAAAERELGNHRLPMCTEPWTSLYILRRGLRPCCYGGAPVGDMDDHQAIWNSKLLRDLRADLARGILHDYCIKSPACPIVRKAHRTDRLGARGTAVRAVWRAWHWLNASTGQVPRRLLHLVRGRA